MGFKDGYKKALQESRNLNELFNRKKKGHKTPDYGEIGTGPSPTIVDFDGRLDNNWRERQNKHHETERIDSYSDIDNDGSRFLNLFRRQDRGKGRYSKFLLKPLSASQIQAVYDRIEEFVDTWIRSVTSNSKNSVEDRRMHGNKVYECNIFFVNFIPDTPGGRDEVEYVRVITKIVKRLISGYKEIDRN